MKSPVRNLSPRSMVLAVSVVAAMAALAGCDKRPTTPPATDTAPVSTPTAPASAASR